MSTNRNTRGRTFLLALATVAAFVATMFAPANPVGATTPTGVAEEVAAPPQQSVGLLLKEAYMSCSRFESTVQLSSGGRELHLRNTRGEEYRASVSGGGWFANEEILPLRGKVYDLSVNNNRQVLSQVRSSCPKKGVALFVRVWADQANLATVTIIAQSQGGVGGVVVASVGGKTTDIRVPAGGRRVFTSVVRDKSKKVSARRQGGKEVIGTWAIPFPTGV